MTKLTIVAAVAAMALFATATVHTAKAGEGDFHTYTTMPTASTTHAYTPAPAQPGPKTYSPYTKLPSGSVAQAQRAQAHSSQK